MVLPKKVKSNSILVSNEYNFVVSPFDNQTIFPKRPPLFKYPLFPKSFNFNKLEEKKTLIDILSFHAKTKPNKTAFIFLNEKGEEQNKLTYKELHTKAKVIGTYIQENNFHHVPILLLHPPGIEFIIDFFGCIYGGAIAVPLFPPKQNTKQNRIKSIIKDTNAIIGFTTESIKNQHYKDSSLYSELEAIKLLSVQNLDPKLEKKWKKPNVTATDTAFIQFTSGSTADPKGVINSHHNIITNQHMIKCASQTSGKTRICGWTPHYHDMGIIANILHPIYIGGFSILMSPTAFIRNPFIWLKTISDYQIDYSGGPNFSYELCTKKIAKEKLETLNLSSWKIAFNGAEPIKAETLTNFSKKFKECNFSFDAFCPIFGLAETTCFATSAPYDQSPVLLPVDKDELAANTIKPPKNSKDELILVGCGKSWNQQKIKIVNPDSLTENPKNIVGEIWVQGPNVCKGYWNKPALTDLTFKATLKNEDGHFLRTGDLGFFNDNNDLFVTGRIKDMIIIHGKNIYPHDIENQIESIAKEIKLGGCIIFEYQSNGTQKLATAIEIERVHIKSFNQEKLSQKIIQTIFHEYGFSINDIIYIKPMSLPKTSSGKKQRQLCKQHFINNSLNVLTSKITKTIPKENNHIPLTATEVIISNILKSLLNIPAVPLSSKLEYLGGNSLIMIQIIAEIQNQFGIELNPSELFSEDLTMKLLCQRIDQKQDELIKQLTLMNTQTSSLELAY
tara:strand:+ start:1212 stop:3404 length:2193 start_codon:yes stop_codon:yes gene_type:complete